MDEEVRTFGISVIFPILFWLSVVFLILSIVYVFYYFFIRKNYRYVEDKTKEEECVRCTEANCTKKQIQLNMPEEDFGRSTLYNEKTKIKSNLQRIEDHMYNLKPNNVVDLNDINDITFSQENDFRTIANSMSKGSQNSTKSYMSNMSNVTFVNNIDDKQYNTHKSHSKMNNNNNNINNNSYNSTLNSNLTEFQSYHYGNYGNTRVYGGDIRNNKAMDNEKSQIYKSINKNSPKPMQNYISFNKVFKERSHCTCECHNKEYSKVRVKYKPLDFVSKNNHEFIFWSFFVCLQINSVMVILFGVYSVFPN